MTLYKVQYRHSPTGEFQDDGDWASCEQCVARLRASQAAQEPREVRVIDQKGVVIATTEFPLEDEVMVTTMRS